jgi:hypothetical protein
MFLGLDTRGARRDDLTRERPADADEASAALFLAAASIPTRRPDGRLSPRSVDSIVAEVGRVHGLEVAGVDRKLAVLRPHDCATRSRSGSRRRRGTTGLDSYL